VRVIGRRGWSGRGSRVGGDDPSPLDWKMKLAGVGCVEVKQLAV
jgi:hypothetical protein